MVFALQADALALIAGAATASGLHLCVIAHCKYGRMARVLKGNFSCNWLSFAVVELTLLVDMQPASSLIVFVALDVARLALPLVA